MTATFRRDDAVAVVVVVLVVDVRCAAAVAGIARVG